eukprot:403377538
MQMGIGYIHIKIQSQLPQMLESLICADGGQLTDNQRRILMNLDQISKSKLQEQFKTYKKMFQAQPQRIRDLFGDRITEIQRKNQSTKQKEAVKFEVYKFHQNLSTIPNQKRSKEEDQLQALVNLCHNLNTDEDDEADIRHEDQFNPKQKMKMRLELQNQMNPKYLAKTQKIVNDNFLYKNKGNKNLLHSGSKKNTNKVSSAQSSCGGDSHILSPVNAIQKVITKSTNPNNNSSPMNSSKFNPKLKKPGFRIKKQSQHNDISDIVLHKFQNQHIVEARSKFDENTILQTLSIDEQQDINLSSKTHTNTQTNFNLNSLKDNTQSSKQTLRLQTSHSAKLGLGLNQISNSNNTISDKIYSQKQTEQFKVQKQGFQSSNNILSPSNNSKYQGSQFQSLNHNLQEQQVQQQQQQVENSNNTSNTKKLVHLNRLALKHAKQQELRDKNEFHQKFINHKNSAVKILNTTFKNIKLIRIDQELKGRVSALKDELKTKKDLIKLQNKFRDEYKLATHKNIPSYIEEFNTRVVTPMFTIPRHPNDIFQIMKTSQREVFSAQADYRAASLMSRLQTSPQDDTNFKQNQNSMQNTQQQYFQSNSQHQEFIGTPQSAGSQQQSNTNNNFKLPFSQSPNSRQLTAATTHLNFQSQPIQQQQQFRSNYNSAQSAGFEGVPGGGGTMDTRNLSTAGSALLQRGSMIRNSEFFYKQYCLDQIQHEDRMRIMLSRQESGNNPINQRKILLPHTSNGTRKTTQNLPSPSDKGSPHRSVGQVEGWEPLSGRKDYSQFNPHHKTHANFNQNAQIVKTLQNTAISQKQLLIELPQLINARQSFVSNHQQSQQNSPANNQAAQQSQRFKYL